MFKVSTKARYALRAMIELAIRDEETFVPLAELAEAQGISPKYLEQLAITLRNAGLVRSERGPKGGYALALRPQKITVLDIVSAIEGPVVLLSCLQRAGLCQRARDCAARRFWQRLNESITAVLVQSTLAELRDEQQTDRMDSAPSYSI